MKLVTFVGILLAVQSAIAGGQYSFCRNPQTELSVCWETAGLYLKSNNNLEDLKFVPFDLPEQEIYSNSDRSVLVQTLQDRNYLLIDKTGEKFELQCELAKNGKCH